MKRINIFYWICTGIICALMLFSAVSSFTSPAQSQALMHTQLGYPPYFIPFLAVAKFLGVLALLVPGFPRLREWAYAGFAFDLIGATYSFIAIGTPASQWAPMFVFIAIFALSYIFWRKKQAAA